MRRKELLLPQLHPARQHCHTNGVGSLEVPYNRQRIHGSKWKRRILIVRPDLVFHFLIPIVSRRFREKLNFKDLPNILADTFRQRHCLSTNSGPIRLLLTWFGSRLLKELLLRIFQEQVEKLKSLHLDVAEFNCLRFGKLLLRPTSPSPPQAPFLAS